MPDIAMCASVCPSSGTCRRHEDSGTVPSVDWQSWCKFDVRGDKCRHYVGTEGGKHGDDN